MQAISAIERSTDPIDLRRQSAVAVAIGVLAQIGIPLVHGHGRTVLTIAAVLSLFLAAVLHALSESALAMLVSLGVLCGGGLLIEAVGVRSGLPFGSYEYTRGLGLQIIGVPVVVPLAWMMLGWPAFVAARKVGNAPLVGAAILTTWDLLLDPQMVKAGYWVWKPTSFPKLNGIPLSNAIGWAIVSALMMWALDRLVDVDVVSDGMPLLVLTWTWFSSILGALVFGLSKPLVGVVGGIAFTIALAPVALRTFNDVQRRSVARQRRSPAAAPARRPAPGGSRSTSLE